MRITVNGEQIQYSLEHERNLQEVLIGIRDWLSSSGALLMEARADGVEVRLSSTQELAKTPIAGISELSITARPAIEVDQEDLEAIREFFQITKRSVELGDAEAAKGVLSNFDAVRNNLERVLDRHGISRELAPVETLDALIVGSGLQASGKIETSSRGELVRLIDALTSELDLRLQEFANPRSELRSAAGDLVKSIDELSDVSVMLQTGRDADAMQVVVRFTELSSRLVRLYPLVRSKGGVDFGALAISGVSFPDFYVEFNNILSELIDAFSAGDSILIGDLLEYEVAPRLEKLRTYVDLLTNTEEDS
ncbi:MAG TPA: hypothetical protein VMV68_00210 [Spirochaetia bacterium]|nr:hypothetical protein [Spirochaetia bacterium]